MNKWRTFLLSIIGGYIGAGLLVLILTLSGVGPFKSESSEKVSLVGVPVTTGSVGGLTPSQIYQRWSPGVVEIVVNVPAQAGPLGPVGGGQALGSGFVVSTTGYILTNAHVVDVQGQAAKTVSVAFKVSGSSTRHVTARVVGFDNTSDVALIQVDPARSPHLDPLPLGHSSTVLVGEPVVAIGNPLGFAFSLTSGIVSAVHRDLQSPNGATITNGIQTDAAINEGNSGGPLIDASGHVIGINEQIASQSGGNQGLGFAVPIDTAVTALKQLQATGTVKYAWLGVAGQTITGDLARTLHLPASQGVLIAQVVPGSPADRAGLKGGSGRRVLQGVTVVTGGDILTAVNGTQLATMDQLASYVSARRPGDHLTLTVIHNGQGKAGGSRRVSITLGTRPAGL
jgi:S1-C subfamily serine protease